MKLGEALVSEGLITREQLRRALERQVIFGGRIGTNIVEIGILSEEDLTKFLSKYFKVPYARPQDLQNVDEEAISALSADLADKYKAVPFKKEKNRLHVAMLDAKNIQAIDEFRFVSGYDIIPYISSELRLLYALEKYYGIKRDIRFVSLIDKESVEEEKKPEPISEDSLKKIKEAFTIIKGKDEIAGLLVSEASKNAKRIAVFIVKGTEVSGWFSKGLNTDSFKSNATPPSLFYDVLTGGHYFRGPVLNIPGNKDLIGLLGGTPQDSLTVPITIRDRIIALLYADNGNTGVLDANLAHINTLCRLAALSFELLIIKKKIMEL